MNKISLKKFIVDTPPTPACFANPLVGTLRSQGFSGRLLQRAAASGGLSQQIVPKIVLQLGMRNQESEGIGCEEAEALAAMKENILEIAISHFDLIDDGNCTVPFYIETLIDQVVQKSAVLQASENQKRQYLACIDENTPPPKRNSMDYHVEVQLEDRICSPNRPRHNSPLHAAPLPAAPLPPAPLPSAPLPPAPLPSASEPPAPLPSAPLPPAPLPSASEPPAPLPSASDPRHPALEPEVSSDEDDPPIAHESDEEYVPAVLASAPSKKRGRRIDVIPSQARKRYTRQAARLGVSPEEDQCESPTTSIRCLSTTDADETFPNPFTAAFDTLQLQTSPIKPKGRAAKSIGALSLMGSKAPQKGPYKSRRAVVNKMKRQKQKNEDRLTNSTEQREESLGLTLTKWQRKIESRNAVPQGKFYLDENSISDEQFLSTGTVEFLDASEESKQQILFEEKYAIAPFVEEIQKITKRCSEEDARQEKRIQEEKMTSRLRLSLRKYFKVPTFRPGQLKAIRHVLSRLPEIGCRATLVVLPTGRGKSLIYHMATFHLASEWNSLSVMICPTVSLIEDQLRKLPKCLKGVRLDHTVASGKSRQKIYTLLDEGNIDVLITTPEQIQSQLLQAKIRAGRRNLGLLVLDEAHCISEWGNSFRPAYTKVIESIKAINPLIRILALTATATNSTIASIKSHLGDSNASFIDSDQRGLRETLTASVSSLTTRDDYSLTLAVKDILKGKNWKKMRSILVFVWKQSSAEAMARELSRYIPHLVSSYHSGMLQSEKQKVQAAFLDGSCRILVATMAFGIGIDNPKIDGVLHANLPSSIEQFVQETGRCNRSGLGIGSVHTILRDADYRLRYQQIAGSSLDFVAIRSFFHLLQGIVELHKDKECTKCAFCEQGLHYKRGQKSIISIPKRIAVESTNSRSFEDLEVMLSVLTTSSVLTNDNLKEVKIEKIPAHTLELRCFGKPLSDILDLEPKLSIFKDFIKTRDAVNNLNSIQAMLKYNLTYNELEESVQIICSDHQMTAFKKPDTMCFLFTFNEDLNSGFVDNMVFNLKEVFSSLSRCSLNRLDAVYLSLKEAEENSIQNLLDRIEEYFRWDSLNERQDPKFLWKPEELEIFDRAWPQLSSFPCVDSFVKNFIQGTKRQPLTWQTYRRGCDSLYSANDLSLSPNDLFPPIATPLTVSRILAGLTSFTIPWKDGSNCTGWQKFADMKFEELVSRIDQVFTTVAHS
eukprot:GHVP01068871.1.p1 GENE.GHVP01068871.1~~GHVP01068871.1.p1  ORF type:complete len:1226 (+),score=278.29 GHVP01068871.1:3643-7320(+)